MTATIEFRRDQIDAIRRIFRAQARLHRATRPLLDERADVDTLDAARVVDEAFGVLGARAGRGENSVGQHADANASAALEVQRCEEFLEQLQFPLGLALVELEAGFGWFRAARDEFAGEHEAAARGRVETKLSGIGENAGVKCLRRLRIDG